MGLDMYLHRKVGIFDFNAEKTTSVTGFPPCVGKRSFAVMEEVCYWRKANQIHRWFVDHVQNGDDNCSNYTYCDIEKIKELYDLICKGLETKTDTWVEENLQPQTGFFFGDTCVDTWYWEDLEQTKEKFEEILKEHEEITSVKDVFVSYFYNSSW